MKITVKTGDPAGFSTDLLAIPIGRSGGHDKRAEAKPRVPRPIQALDRGLGGVIRSAVASGDFDARRGEKLLLYPTKGQSHKRVLLLGMGEENDLDAETVRRLAATALSEARDKGAARVAIRAPSPRGLTAAECAAALAEGAVLGAYRFDAYRSKKAEKGKKGREPSAAMLVFDALEKPASVRRSAANAVIVAESQRVARDLSNEPPNSLPPSALARAARRVARETGLTCRVMHKSELEKRGFSALLAVGGGSACPPNLIVLEHRGGGAPAKSRRTAPTLCLVGKGITFDSGGLSLKPALSLGDMKHDMSGAATVVGALRAVALLDLPLHVVGVIAAAENMPSGSAYRPGDIVRTLSGHTIEITNTDAEGRVVLADALHYAASHWKPEWMVDVATLTGATMVAFGPWVTAALGNDEKLLEALRAAGEATGELTWPMPLLPEHRRAMASTVADLKNSGGRDAGASTAAAFLKDFVGDTRWAHLDIAGSGWTTTRSPYHRGGATGVGVRLLVELLRREVQQNA
jgi:leucyl aminopeptidase